MARKRGLVAELDQEINAVKAAEKAADGGDTTTTTTPARVPAKKTVAKKKSSGGIVDPFGSSGTNADSNSGTLIHLPDAQQLEAQGLPRTLAKLFAKETVTLNTNDGENPTGVDFLNAVNGLSAGSFNGLKVTDADVEELKKSVLTYMGINPNGTYEQQEDAADQAVTYIPKKGDQAGDLSAAQVPVGTAQDVEDAAQNAAYAKELKTDTATITQLKNAVSSGNEAADTGATVSAQYTAEATADSDLTNWGIDTPEMNRLVARLAAEGVTNTNEILQNIRQTKTYQTAFAGLAEYNAQPGHVHMTESEYRTYSQSVLGASQQYGVPKGFIDQSEIGKLLVGNVSASEFQQRVEDIYSAVSNMDAGAKADLQNWYGIGPSDLLTYFANPNKALPALQRQVASAEIGDYASRVGLSGLSETDAQQLAQQAKLSAAQGNNQLGTGVSTIEGSLLSASKDAALLGSNPGAQAPSIDTNDLIGSQIAGFGGTNQRAAQSDVEQAEQAKAAPFEKGGGFAQSEKGVTGIGSATT
jgi:hypothetical protein